MTKRFFEEKVTPKHRESVMQAVSTELEKKAASHRDEFQESRRKYMQNIFWWLSLSAGVATSLILWVRNRSATNEFEDSAVVELSINNVDMILGHELLEDLELLENLDILEKWEDA